DERALGAPTRMVDGASDELLAGTALAGEQHGRLLGSDPRRLIQRLPKGWSLPDDALEPVLFAQSPTKPRLSGSPGWLAWLVASGRQIEVIGRRRPSYRPRWLRRLASLSATRAAARARMATRAHRLRGH